MRTSTIRITGFSGAVLFLLLLIPAFGLAQNQNFRENVSKRGTTAASFLEIGVGSRALALGSAFTAMADDPSAIYWNAGGLAKQQRHGILFNHSEWIGDTQFDFMAASFSTGRWGTVAFSLTSLNMDEMEVTTLTEPDGNGQFFDAGDLAISVAYAIALTDRFSIGMNTKIVHQSIADMGATGFAADIGVHYLTPFPGVTLGMAMTNFGTKMKLTGNNTLILHDPDPNTSGNNGRIPANQQTEAWSMPLNFRVGLAWQALNTGPHKAHLAVDAQHPNNNYESVHVGGEYVFRNTIALRGGYRNLFLDDTEESYTFGAGLFYPIVGNMMLQFDFAYADFGLLEDVQKYSISLRF